MQNRVELKYPVAFTERATINEFFLLGQKGGVIPQSFLFDREGQWRGVFQGGSSNVIESMKENVEKIVKEK